VQFHPGDSVGCGKDHTLFALKSGIVVYKRNKYIKKVPCPCHSQRSAMRFACRHRLEMYPLHETVAVRDRYYMLAL
jgi:hypothetical protein